VQKCIARPDRSGSGGTAGRSIGTVLVTVPTRQDLHEAVVADPDADAPRLAYAEDCDVRGDSRGQFIRLQIEATKLRREGWTSRSYEPADRANLLLHQHRSEWLAPLGSLAPEPRFYRGFVEGVTMTADQFLANAAALYRRAPIRHVRFRSAAARMKELADSPLLAQLATLTLYDNQLGDAEVELLAASPHVGHVKLLDLGGNHIGEPGLFALCASQTLTHLRRVNLAGNPVERHEEGFGVDGLSGVVVPESIYLDDYARGLEAKFGRRAWFHPVSELPNYPPLEGDL
jgi:uncharacterized protein (TIGR02996 family)